MKINRRIVFSALAAAIYAVGIFVVSARADSELLVSQTNNAADQEWRHDAFTNVPDSKLNAIFRDQTLSRKQAIKKLLDVFDSSESKPSTKGYVAYYLGQLHATEAIDELANNISFTLVPPFTGHLYEDEAPWRYYPSMRALITIGSPAVPAIIRNLAEKEDDSMRKMSLTALGQIDGNRDVVQLNLQRAIEMEKDSTKKSRLQAALKELSQ